MKRMTFNSDKGVESIEFDNDLDRLVPFVYVTNNDMIMHCMRSVYTLFKYKRPGYNMAVVIYLSDDFTEMTADLRREMRMLNALDMECRVRFARFPPFVLDRVKRLNQYTLRLPWTCARWFVPELVDGVPTGFYVDSDTLFLSDPVECLDRHGIDVSGDLPMVSGADDVFTGSSFPEGYRNAGFLMMNLKRCRENGFTQKLETSMKDYQYGCLDQECLNSVYREELSRLKLPSCMNMSTGAFKSIRIGEDRDIVMAHFTGDSKYGSRHFGSNSPFDHRFIYESWLYESMRDNF